MDSRTTIEKYYNTSEDFRRYLISNKKRVNQFKKMIKLNNKFFGDKVLDIACGGGILGFLIEKAGHNYTGIDINSDMINSAREYAKEIGSRNKFILGDITEKKIKGKFDTFTCLGNSLCHLTTHDFVKTMENLKSNTEKGSYFILEYKDVVELLFTHQWKKRIIENDKGKTIISLTTGADMKQGEIFKKAFDKNGGNEIDFIHTIWSPFILESLMKSFGWKLVKRIERKEWYRWFEVYQKIKS